MPGLYYVGKTPANGRDLATRKGIEDLLAGGVSRSYVTDRVNTLAALRATKVYTDTQDAQFASAGYIAQRDALNIPATQLAAANGVAGLDANRKIFTAHLPVLGAGILRGPFGYTTALSGTTGLTPMKIAEFPGGPSGITGQIMAFANLSAASNGGRSVVEIRAGASTDTTYASQTLIAQGFGRSHFLADQMITVFPVSHLNGTVPATWASTTNLLVNMWIYDDSGGQTTVQPNRIATACYFLARTTL